MKCIPFITYLFVSCLEVPKYISLFQVFLLYEGPKFLNNHIASLVQRLKESHWLVRKGSVRRLSAVSLLTGSHWHFGAWSALASVTEPCIQLPPGPFLQEIKLGQALPPPPVLRPLHPRLTSLGHLSAHC